MDIATEKESMEVVDLLWEAIGEEIPDKVKLLQLSRAMYKDDREEGKKRFKELLRSLTPELVRFSNDGFFTGNFGFFQVSTTAPNRYGSVLQDAVIEGKSDFVRLLLEYGWGFENSFSSIEYAKARKMRKLWVSSAHKSLV